VAAAPRSRQRTDIEELFFTELPEPPADLDITFVFLPQKPLPAKPPAENPLHE
jgi:hypothetical protein